MQDKDFIFNGYNKYHLWTGLYYDYLIHPKYQHLSRKERKQMALKIYLKLLGFKSGKEVQ